MQELRYLHYYTVYSYSSINARGIKSSVYNHHKSVCFASLFRHLRGVNCPKGEYTIFVSTDRTTLDTSKANYCFLPKKEIVNHIKRLQQTIPEVLEFSITPKDFENHHGYEITLVIDGARTLVHRYALTWVRYLYETCFSLALLDATRLAKLPEFRFVSYANILNIVQACFPDKVPNYNSWHSIGRMCPHTFLTKKELRKKLNEAQSLNSLYEDKVIEAFKRISAEKCYDLEFWESEESFVRKRLPVYRILFNLTK